MINWDEVEFFDKREFTNPSALDEGLLRDLVYIRRSAGTAIYITSSFRAGDLGEHGEGLALDISDNLEGNEIGSRWRFEVLRAIFKHNINRIGVYDRHIHIGVSETRDMDVCWWGVSD